MEYLGFKIVVKFVPIYKKYFIFKISAGFADKFGLTPTQYGENLRDQYLRNDIEQYPYPPAELAADFCCPLVACIALDFLAVGI